MLIHRATLVGLAVLFTAAMSSAASAGCCGGCGGCGTPSAAYVYAQPVAPAPPPPPPPVVTNAWTWGTGCGCHRSVVYVVPPVQPTVIAPAPIYVVNQGPDYVGPGIMVPYRTWSPNAGIVAPGAYPYVPGYGSGYGYPAYPAPGPRVAYRTRFIAHAHYHGPMPLTHHWHR